jgi:transcriptional regulator with XRE-family HTH domain
MTQEEVADKIGVSAQAVSKWEAGDCLPDCFNLKTLGNVYGISLDILLETESSGDIDSVAAKIEQLGDEFIWEKQSRSIPNLHRDLGDDLWKMWKGLYFIEIGNKEFQDRDKKLGNMRVCSEYGMKIWDDDGVACVVKSSLRDKLSTVGDRELKIMEELCSKEGFTLISMLDSSKLTAKAELVEKSGIEIRRLNELLLLLTESKIIEFVYENTY